MERVLSFVICCVYGTKTKSRTLKTGNAHRLLSHLRKKIGLSNVARLEPYVGFEEFLTDESTPKYVLKKFGEVEQSEEEFIREPSFFDWLQSSHAVPRLPNSEELSLLVSWLEEGGFAAEALFLRTPALLEEAAKLIVEHRVITIACPAYPPQLCILEVKAPPVLYVSHPSMVYMPPWFDNKGNPRTVIAAAGSRQPLTVAHALAKSVGGWVASIGALGVSGGAEGCDTAFAQGVVGAGGEVVHFLPHGLGAKKLNPLYSYLSVCPFDEPFSAARAMERNSMIYAFGTFTLICCSRYRVGGTWIGATQALQMHRPVAVINWSWILEAGDRSGSKLSSPGQSLGGFQPREAPKKSDPSQKTQPSHPHGSNANFRDQNLNDEGLTQFWAQKSSEFAAKDPLNVFASPQESSASLSRYGELSSEVDFALDEVRSMNALTNGVHMQAQKALEALGAYSLKVDPRNVYDSVQAEMPAALEWAQRLRSGDLNFGLFA